VGSTLLQAFRHFKKLTQRLLDPAGWRAKFSLGAGEVVSTAKWPFFTLIEGVTVLQIGQS
jgi:hypothetical protein